MSKVSHETTKLGREPGACVLVLPARLYDRLRAEGRDMHDCVRQPERIPIDSDFHPGA